MRKIDKGNRKETFFIGIDKRICPTKSGQDKNLVTLSCNSVQNPVSIPESVKQQLQSVKWIPAANFIPRLRGKCSIKRRTIKFFRNFSRFSLLRLRLPRLASSLRVQHTHFVSSLSNVFMLGYQDVVDLLVDEAHGTFLAITSRTTFRPRLPSSSQRRNRFRPLLRADTSLNASTIRNPVFQASSFRNGRPPALWDDFSRMLPRRCIN